MSGLAEHTENIIWPRYRDDVSALGRLAWLVARKGNPKLEKIGEPPPWFQEILDAQAKALLNFAFRSKHDWLIFPEAIAGFSMTIRKTKNQAGGIVPKEAPPLRHHTFDQFSEMARLAEGALARLLRAYMKSAGGDVVEMENEDALIYLFPRERLEENLRRLGFPEDAIPKLLKVEDIETNFFPEREQATEGKE